ncbi:hypothetical protein AB0J52_01740 [Spirillospora sp. NPDC049652]
MDHRRTAAKAGPAWIFLAGAAAITAAVVAFLARRRTETTGTASEVVPAHPVRTRKGRDAPMARRRTARKAGFNWPLLLGVITTFLLIWLWWWAAAGGGP